MDTSYPKTLTYSEADLALRFFLNEYHEAYGLALGTDFLGPFRRELSYRLNADFANVSALEDAIEALDILAKLEASTHPDLHENATGTVSNRQRLTEEYESALNLAVHAALVSANFDGSLIIRAGERRLLCAA